jgi:hypothetical protein
MYSTRDDPLGRVSPFGYPRIKVCSRLPMAFRSVPRPSSPLSAKASTRCPFALDCRAVAYRGKPHQHDCSDFSAFGFPCSQHSKVPTTWGQDCNLFTMSNNAVRRASSTYEYLNFCRAYDQCSKAQEPRRTTQNWWSWTGSNRRPPACKAGALPTELQPRPESLVGLGRLELPTSRLSSARSNQLSYRPGKRSSGSLIGRQKGCEDGGMWGFVSK